MRKFDHVFVLGTGRCGTTGFVRACEHFTNYTAGHETRCSLMGEDRLAYPVGHIEADNRLSWMLGRLDARYGDSAFYVHLTRDPDEVAESYLKRWGLRYSLVLGYSRSILKQDRPEKGASRDMVETVDENVKFFLRDKSHTMQIDLTEISERFPEFAKRVGAEGNMEAALAALGDRHNRSAEQATDEPPVLEELVDANHNLRIELKREVRRVERAKEERAEVRREMKRLERFMETESEMQAAKLDDARLAFETVGPLKEFDQLRRELKRTQKQRNMALIPWAILLFPIAIPIWLIERRKEAKRKEAVNKKAAERRAKWEATEKTLREEAEALRNK